MKYELPIRLLQKYDYNLKGRMGTLLRRKWDFANRKESAEAYFKAFGKTSEKVIKSIFQEERLQWLAATRNVIVHNGSVADAEFVSLVDKHPTFSAIKEGERIPLNGTVVADFSLAASSQSIALLKFVDDWLAATKPTILK